MKKLCLEKLEKPLKTTKIEKEEILYSAPCPEGQGFYA